jgi:glycosyltransferase involved in cell wall biosynthesis
LWGCIPVFEPKLAILHAVISLDVGGLERLVSALIRQGRRIGHDVSAVCTERLGRLAEAVKADGAQAYCLGKRRGEGAAFARRVTELLAQIKPDVVHTHQIAAAWGIGRAAAKLGIPVVHTEHGNHFSRSEGWLSDLKQALLYRLAFRRIERVFCVSTEIADVMKRRRIAPSSKIAVVTNGVGLESFADLPSSEQARQTFGIPIDAFVLGTVGRLVEVKRQEFLLRGAARLRERIPNLWVLLVGDGPERCRLEGVAKELGLGDRCVFAGFQSRPEIGLRAMDVFALTSRSEGLPVSLLEAWACGIPIAAAAVGGIPDVVAHEKMGMLFEGGNEPEFCDAIERLFTDRELSAAIKRAAGKEVQEKFSHQQMMNTYEREYRKIVVARRGALICAS